MSNQTFEREKTERLREKAREIDPNFPKSKIAKYDNTKPNIALLCAGSFSPLTIGHLRLLEVARDKAIELGFNVIGGWFSSVSDSYGKKGLESSKHRNAMISLSVSDSSWIDFDPWESQQSESQPTVVVLEHFEKQLEHHYKKPVTVCLCSGADLLESFLIPNYWDTKDVRDIITRKFFVLARQDISRQQIIWNSDLLYSLKQHIILVDDHFQLSISSTEIRKFLSRGLSIQYLVHEKAIKYIHDNKLFGYDNSKL